MFPVQNPWVWIVTGVILLVGILIFVWAATSAVQQRQTAMQQVQVGDPATRATQVLGIEPIVCDANSLAYLEGSFPEGWPAAAVNLSIESLEEVTDAVWVFPIRPRDTGCAAHPDRTELGVAADGTIVWLVPVLGRTPLHLPEWLTPAGIADVAGLFPGTRGN
jgi:hypothetical protein